MRYLSGPEVCGFYGMFETNFGDPETPAPYARVTPSCVAGVLLPFSCPNCKTVLSQFSDPKTREHYHDDRDGRDNFWCPTCDVRFNLRLQGMPLPKNAALVDGAAPSLVERFQDSDDSKIITHSELQDNDASVVGRLFRHFISGSDVLGYL